MREIKETIAKIKDQPNGNVQRKTFADLFTGTQPNNQPQPNVRQEYRYIEGIEVKVVSKQGDVGSKTIESAVKRYINPLELRIPILGIRYGMKSIYIKTKK